jgi:hypothetical protein
MLLISQMQMPADFNACIENIFCPHHRHLSIVQATLNDRLE